MITITDKFIAIETEHTGYYLAERAGQIENLGYGKKIHADVEVMRAKIDCGYGTDTIYRKEEPISLQHLCLELSPMDKGDYRQGALGLRLSNGSGVCDLRFVSAEKLHGCISLDGLPAAYGGEETLILHYGSSQGVEADLYYTVYPECDVITRRMQIRNTGDGQIVIYRCMSYQLDLPGEDYTLFTYTGAWARERHESSADVTQGIHGFGSRTGASSHFVNPFFMLAGRNAGEQDGRVYGFNLIYSGSHAGQVEQEAYGKIRVQAGIQPEGFAWTLEPGEKFDTPEAVLTFSEHGKNGVSNHMHHFVKDHILRGKWAKAERPVLLNNWEATYFDFKESRLMKLAREAKKLGIELFVLDDGWFGQRNDDTKGLGDYAINRKKLPGGLEGLAGKINGLGMDFGLWMEPEMVNEDSNLYRQHPEWTVKVPGIEPSAGRNQLVLDFCRKEVQDYVIRMVNDTLHGANIKYVKWDMNRAHSDRYSMALEEQSRFGHAWVLGLYRVLDALTKANPEVLFEGCASGGNRFDLGILCYMPQIWASDDTDTHERMKIQTGTSYGYPQCTYSCHVSSVPNHQTTRVTPLESRFDVAAFGVLGYELDLTQVSSVEKKVMAEQIRFYKEHRKLLQYGDFWRLISPFAKSERCAWIVVSEDKTEALMLEATGRLEPNSEPKAIRMVGLDQDTCYAVANRKQMIDVRCVGSLINQVLPVKVDSNGLLVHIAADHYMLTCETENYTAYGDLLMETGIRPKQHFIGTGYNENIRLMPDYSARIYCLKKQNALK